MCIHTHIHTHAQHCQWGWYHLEERTCPHSFTQAYIRFLPKTLISWGISACSRRFFSVFLHIISHEKTWSNIWPHLALDGQVWQSLVLDHIDAKNLDSREPRAYRILINKYAVFLSWSLHLISIMCLKRHI